MNPEGTVTDTKGSADAVSVLSGHPRLILEAGNCRNNLGWATNAVAEAAFLGAWGFKVQMYRPETLVSSDALTYGEAALQEPAYQAEAFAGPVPYRQWMPIKELCDEYGLTFFASVFDFEAVEACEYMRVGWYKIASADITHRPLIDRVAHTGKPIILSTGGATLGEVQDALDWIGHDQVVLLACSLHYPSTRQEANLSRMWALAGFGLPVGYSNHVPDIEAVRSAIELGAVMVETHFTITPGVGGDHNFGFTPAQLQDWNKPPADPFDDLFGLPYMGPHPGEELAVRRARRSLHTVREKARGGMWRWDDFAYLRPGDGVPPYAAFDLVGRKVHGRYRAGDRVVPAELWENPPEVLLPG